MINNQAVESFESFRDDLDGIYESIQAIRGSRHLENFPVLSGLLNQVNFYIENMPDDDDDESDDESDE